MQKCGRDTLARNSLRFLGSLVKKVVGFESRGSPRPSESSLADPSLRRRRACHSVVSLVCAGLP